MRDSLADALARDDAVRRRAEAFNLRQAALDELATLALEPEYVPFFADPHTLKATN